ncbi:MAG: quinone oxidoreductase [Bacteroidia bacterium]
MKTQAFQIHQFGDAQKAFRLTEFELPSLREGFVRIRVEAFGLNFADVMARKGLYRELPPLPAVPGYEVVGVIDDPGSSAFRKGERVLAFTRFGGYARHVIADARVVTPVPDSLDVIQALACATQGCTAWYAAEQCFPVRKGDHALVLAAAGGVGSILVQMLAQKGAVVYGATRTASKSSAILGLGAHHVIITQSADPAEYIFKHRNGKGFDVVYDNAGGKTFRKLMKTLEPGGRIAGYGAAERLNLSGPLATVRLALGFGFINPVQLLMPSKTIAGINMLRIADNKPEIIGEGMREMINAIQEQKLRVINGGVFPHHQLAEAHTLLESGTSTGKIAVVWES